MQELVRLGYLKTYLDKRPPTVKDYCEGKQQMSPEQIWGMQRRRKIYVVVSGMDSFHVVLPEQDALQIRQLGISVNSSYEVEATLEDIRDLIYYSGSYTRIGADNWIVNKYTQLGHPIPKDYVSLGDRTFHIARHNPISDGDPDVLKYKTLIEKHVSETPTLDDIYGKLTPGEIKFIKEKLGESDNGDD